MDIKTKNQKENVNNWPEKLYTQQEVDTLYQKREKSNSSQVREIQVETQSRDKQKRIENTIVEGLVRQSNRILTSISSHGFPFDFFPNTINIEEGRITIIIRRFLFSSEVHSVDIKDISNIFINTAPFFAELVIVSKTFSENQIKIRNLRKEEAVFARRIIEGLRIFENKKIDTSNYTRKELIAKLEELSTTDIMM